MTPVVLHDTPHDLHRVPPSALVISVIAMAIPVAVVAWAPDWENNGLGMLIWLTALIPAFLLAFYRGLRGVAVALVGGMAVIVGTQIGIVIFATAEPDWTLLSIVVLVYLVVSLGIGGLAELLIRERRIAQAMALVDPLTGLANRRHLEIVLAGEFAAAERGRKMVIVMFDLDEFKLVNDTRGHRAGDSTLQAFAKILQRNTRAENLSARYGGEEFVTVLRDATADDASTFASRVLEETRAWPLPWGCQTVSAGVAGYETGMGSYELLLGAADLALYAAKEAGRDCVCFAPVSERLVVSAVAVGAVEVVVTPVRACLVWAVDDSAFMRSTLKGMLARGGYPHWITASPREVVTRYAETPPAERPDVILADVIMPELSGPRMIGEILKISAAVRVIYMSAYVQSEISWNGTPEAEVGFLEKPFGMDTLFATLSPIPARAAGVAGSAA
jgi:diguanylate cyclase (GGDEF)-like protein